MKDSEIEVVHFYNGPGRRGSYRVIHMPSGLFVESPTDTRGPHVLVQQLRKQLWDKVTRICPLRDTLGNLLCPAILDPNWLAWNDGTVRKIAQSIYEERAFDRLPILADALTDAGCDNADLLHHCRSEGPHVKGCWVVDLLLGKT